MKVNTDPRQGLTEIENKTCHNENLEETIENILKIIYYVCIHVLFIISISGENNCIHRKNIHVSFHWE